MPLSHTGTVLMLVCAAANQAGHAAGASPELLGIWEMTLRGGETVLAGRATVTGKGEGYEWKFGGSDFAASLRGDRMEVKCSEEGRACGSLEGSIRQNQIVGEGKLEGIPMSWSAKRPLVRPGTGPARHEFQPVTFYREFSSAKDPALHIFPGDTVHTTTVDAGGRDEKGVRRVFGGNPLTGPFYVEGAMPGDSLVVRFTKVKLNRDSAMSGDRVVPSALEPSGGRAQAEEAFDSSWTLDHAKGVARLTKPTERLKNYEVPLRPMVGCVGVAPPSQQSFRAGYLGDWGGNMDYNELREGTTVTLPVFAQGALLFVGDGHAAEGDGELTGDALETSMEVEFTVDLKQDTKVRQVRFENSDYVMVSGMGGSLNEALQRATSGLSRFLAQEYKLNAAETGIVLGTAMRYDIAEVVDPLVHIVAKVPKTALAGLKRE